MTFFLTLIVAVALILSAALIRRKLENKRNYNRCLNLPNQTLTPERLYSNCHSIWVFERIFGVYFAAGRWLGNCFSPAIVLEWHGVKKPWSSHDPINEEFIANKPPRLQAFARKAKERQLAEPEEIGYPAWATLTLRYRYAETRIYWRGWWRFDFNSEHIARRWGAVQESDHGTCYFYKGWLGYHAYV